MPKKAIPARTGVQRVNVKAQKSFELVRPVTESSKQEAEEIVEKSAEETSITTAGSTASTLDALPTVPKKRARASSVITEDAPVVPVAPKKEAEAPVVATKGNASARLAARKNIQRTQRSSAALITAEHYSYVRKDLIFIAVLATIMIAALAVLYFVPGIGA